MSGKTAYARPNTTALGSVYVPVPSFDEILNLNLPHPSQRKYLKRVTLSNRAWSLYRLTDYEPPTYILSALFTPEPLGPRHRIVLMSLKAGRYGSPHVFHAADFGSEGFLVPSGPIAFGGARFDIVEYPDHCRFEERLR